MNNNHRPLWKQFVWAKKFAFVLQLVNPKRCWVVGSYQTICNLQTLCRCQSKVKTPLYVKYKEVIRWYIDFSLQTNLQKEQTCQSRLSQYVKVGQTLQPFRHLLYKHNQLTWGKDAEMVKYRLDSPSLVCALLGRAQLATPPYATTRSALLWQESYSCHALCHCLSG